MFRVYGMTALFIRRRISPPRAPNSSFIASSTSLDHPPRTSMMMLYCRMSYPGNCCLSFQRRGPYLVVFSSCFFSLFYVIIIILQYIGPFSIITQRRIKKLVTTFCTLRAAGFSYAKRERNHCEQPSAFPSSMREYVTPHVMHLMSISFEMFVQKNESFSPMQKCWQNRKIQTFVEVLFISSLPWSTYEAEI